MKTNTQIKFDTIIKYKPQNRQYKNTQIEKSLKTLINKGIEAKKGEKVDKTKCTITTI